MVKLMNSFDFFLIVGSLAIMANMKMQLNHKRVVGELKRASLNSLPNFQIKTSGIENP